MSAQHSAIKDLPPGQRMGCDGTRVHVACSPGNAQRRRWVSQTASVSEPSQNGAYCVESHDLDVVLTAHSSVDLREYAPVL
jgi:hypothetical protein